MSEINRHGPKERGFAKNRLAAAGKKKQGGFAYAIYWLLSFSFGIWLIWLVVHFAQKAGLPW